MASPASQPSAPSSPRVALVQDGARGHYGLALALHKAGILEAMFTDFFIKPGGLWDILSPLLARFGPGGLRRMLDRRAPGLKGVPVQMSLSRRLAQDRRRKTFSSEVEYFRWQAGDWGKWIDPRLPPAANILMGFIRNIDPELCRRARERGIITVADQMIAPAVVEKRELELQQARFPGWESQGAAELDGFIQIENETWPHLDAITCPSQYVAEGLVGAGVARDRVHVVHYPIDEQQFQFVDRAGRTGPVKVGFVGQINLRKGVPYFVEVAKRFPRDRVQFTLIGKSYLTDTAFAEVRKHVNAYPVVRSEVPAQLASFDLIYFPTTCEGSAYALMEAMATGLPVVTSPNSGTVARHGIEGFLCPYDDLDAATQQIEQLARDPDLRLTLGRAARDRYLQFGLAHYSTELSKLCRQLCLDAKSTPGRNP